MSSKTGKTRKILGSLVVLGVLGGLVGLGAFSAFTANTTNTNNVVSSGTVKIDQDNSATMFNAVTNMKPGSTVQRCVDVAYTGSISADVYLFGTNVTTNGTKYQIQVERGTNTVAPGAGHLCTGGFTSPTTIFTNASLSTFPTAYGTLVAGAAASQAPNTTNGYRFTITRVDDTTLNAHTTATEPTDAMTFTWEARNN